MAREAISESERGLPSPEVRRQILQHAGTILDEARELMERLDRHETVYPRTACDYRSPLWGITERHRLGVLSSPVPGSKTHATRRRRSDHTLAV